MSRFPKTQSTNGKRVETRIVIRANDVIKMGDGLFSVIVPGRALEPDEREVLDRLFPNTQERAFHLLNTEAIIAAIATDAEIRLHEQQTQPTTEFTNPSL